ncbi:hypothetical protein ACET6V_20375, partial [Aeromonas caviae]|uniref:hypothetical protein n=1 Tax=Aeromonas caviae TaxID=648 RepID=UPI0038CF7DDF
MGQQGIYSSHDVALCICFSNGHGTKKGSSRDLGEVEVDRQGAGKLAVSKHTTTITLLSPCIILILP